MQTINTTNRCEQIEAAALTSLHQACPENVRQSLGLALLQQGDSLISIAQQEPSIVINRVIGADDACRNNQIESIMAHYRAAQIDEYFLHCYQDAAALFPHLLKESRAWAKFTRGTEPAPVTRSQLQVREIDRQHAIDFARIASTAFDLSSASIPLLSTLVGQPNWHIFMSFEGETPVGTGALFIHEKTAWFDWGATDPNYRRRGSQSALLCARIEKARQEGCNLMTSATGVAVPGDPQHSYKNLLRHGFKVHAIRDNYVPL